MPDKKKIGAVILAAGSSTRMGEEKQLLPLNGMCMLEQVITNVLAHPFSTVVVVLGHHWEKIRRHISIQDHRIEWVVNDYYQEGQSSSFKEGFQVARQQHCSGIMFFLGDQPFIHRQTISQILQKGSSDLGQGENPFVLRPFYQHHPGHPVFMGNVTKISLPPMEGDQGGKALFHTMRKVNLPCTDPYVIFDIDTKEDYEKGMSMVTE
ncbi:nucleotidyltransferase family protein [Evansella tamaricis]|uniref:Nucleotidyltransferase family protein n=1 Tax=Evansella tamaricis TaxID=2069301 RepID=A0ABS6JJP7_9BACI|nr:nucleotidyltransferase family protein [Evansella tamaricis]MBU9713914.1 nucleotidyltransferase family protein [Evansella tamaricis]